MGLDPIKLTINVKDKNGTVRPETINVAQDFNLYEFFVRSGNNISRNYAFDGSEVLEFNEDEYNLLKQIANADKDTIFSQKDLNKLLSKDFSIPGLVIERTQEEGINPKNPVGSSGIGLSIRTDYKDKPNAHIEFPE